MSLNDRSASAMRSLARFTLSGEGGGELAAPESRREIYRGLIQNVFEDTLQKAFPLAYSLLRGDGSWEQMVQQFVKSGPKSSPQLWRMPHEFLDFCQDQSYGEKFQAPWLMDLLSFEWMEIDLFMRPDSPIIDTFAEYLGGDELLALNPDHEVLALEFPVFRSLEPSNLSERGQFFLLGFRHLENHRVHFIEISPEIVLCQEWLREEPRKLSALARSLDEIHGRNSSVETFNSLEGAFKQLSQQGFVSMSKENFLSKEAT